LHAGLVLRSACTCYRVKTAGSRAVGGHRCARRGSADMLLELHAVKRGLALCACLVLFVLRVCVLELTVLPPAPLSDFMCWNALRLPAFRCVNHTLLILPRPQTFLMHNSPLFLLLCDALHNCLYIFLFVNITSHLKQRWPRKNNLPMKIAIQRPSQLSIPINMSPLSQLTSPNVPPRGVRASWRPCR